MDAVSRVGAVPPERAPSLGMERSAVECRALAALPLVTVRTVCCASQRRVEIFGDLGVGVRTTHALGCPRQRLLAEEYGLGRLVLEGCGR
jgi:hypothetical protein